MDMKNGNAAVTITTKNKVGVQPSRYRSKSIDGLTKGKVACLSFSSVKMATIRVFFLPQK